MCYFSENIFLILGFQEDRKILRALFRAIPLDGKVSSHPIKVNVNGPNEIGQIFDAISYNKVFYGQLKVSYSGYKCTQQ